MSEVIRDLAENDDCNPPSDFSRDETVTNPALSEINGHSGDQKSNTIGKNRLNSIISLIKRKKWFTIFVIAPTLLSAVYYLFIASDQYVSEARFVIKAPNQRPAQVTSLANIIQTAGMSFGLEQTNEVLDYLKSRAAVNDVSKKVDLKGLFSDESADFLSRYPTLWREDRFENLYSYYQGMVDASIDPDSNIAVVRVRAFSPEAAYKINESLLQLSEAIVNRLSQRAQYQGIAEAERRVTQGEARLRKARMAMSRYREAENLLDPAQQAGGVLEISNRLIIEQTALQAQLELMTRVAPENPTIPTLRRKIEANERALASQYGRAVGTRGALAEKLPGYEQVAIEQEMALQNYKIASTALEQARIEAHSQHFYLERISSPRVPDISQYPHRIRTILTIGFSALCLYFVVWMLVVGILQHSPED